MQKTITPAPLSGRIQTIPSKSAAHRLLICAALADRPTRIRCTALSRDIEATAACLRALGAGIEYRDGCYYVEPVTKMPETAQLDCGESGSTLRFMLPIVCALGLPTSIRMHGRLPERPMSPLWEELNAHGCVLQRPSTDVISVSGRLAPGDYSIRADVSSQFVSGLLFALPLLGAESRLELTGSIESAGYIDMTLEAQAKFGLVPLVDGPAFTIPASAAYLSPGSLEVEGDWSNAAFWLVADAISAGSIELEGLDAESAQGDKAVLTAIERIRAGGAVVDMRDIPDLLPVLAVLAAVTPGRTEFVNAGRLRIKESDRLRSVTDMLRALGGDCRETEDGLVIHGRQALDGGVADSANDHRIAMSAAVAAIACKNAVTVLGAEAVEKSYPAFWDDYTILGGIVE